MRVAALAVIAAIFLMVFAVCSYAVLEEETVESVTAEGAGVGTIELLEEEEEPMVIERPMLPPDVPRPPVVPSATQIPATGTTNIPAVPASVGAVKPLPVVPTQPMPVIEKPVVPQRPSEKVKETETIK